MSQTQNTSEYHGRRANIGVTKGGLSHKQIIGGTMSPVPR